jgi:hypothetical protein
MITMSRAMLSSSLQGVVSRLRIIVVLAVLSAVLAGCSAVRLGYNQAPELLYWWLDGYADFDDAQSRRVREMLGQWFSWHRRTQLPDYAGLLVRAQADVLADTSPERTCRWWAVLRQRSEVAADQAAPYAAELILTLSARQIQHIEGRYARTNEEFRKEYLASDMAQRQKNAVKRTLERAEFLYGTLDDAQRERVARLVAASPFDAEVWYAERLQRQREALQLLRRLTGEPVPHDAALAALRVHIERMARSPRENYRRYQEKLELYNCSFAASVHNATTPAQRQGAAARLKGWEADFRALAAAAD